MDDSQSSCQVDWCRCCKAFVIDFVEDLANYFPLNNDLNGFKSRVYRYLQSLGSF